jgi:DNA-binding NarL/FixJ family response regulator
VSKVRVLLADDHPLLLKAVVNLLEPTFEVVGRVGDGKSLFESAMKLQADVIVSDISMPILNGIEAANKLKVSGCRSKIVFLTVHSDPEFVRVCLATGALGYVVKSEMETDLVPAIQEALAGRIFISPPLRHQNCA